ncbi:hypothetical protein EJB05_48490, partial [Eragrostis curvula]
MASGLLILPITPNSCKVTAIEHVQVDVGIHDLFKPCLSGLLFEARRWVVSMARQCSRIRDVYHVNSSHMGGNGNLQISEYYCLNFSPPTDSN